jgi:hypothetical protein
VSGSCYGIEGILCNFGRLCKYVIRATRSVLIIDSFATVVVVLTFLQVVLGVVQVVGSFQGNYFIRLHLRDFSALVLSGTHCDNMTAILSCAAPWR